MKLRNADKIFVENSLSKPASIIKKTQYRKLIERIYLEQLSIKITFSLSEITVFTYCKIITSPYETNFVSLDWINHENTIFCYTQGFPWNFLNKGRGPYIHRKASLRNLGITTEYFGSNSTTVCGWAGLREGQGKSCICMYWKDVGGVSV